MFLDGFIWQKYLTTGTIATIIGTIIFLILIVVTISRGNSINPSSSNLQTALWSSYLDNYWHSNGQVTDPDNNGNTTSEAQSYTLLRAVWQNDPSVFGSTWKWTSSHLQRSDNLFSWLYGTSGILTKQGGQNTASDADTNIALSLILASGKWHNKAYLSDAKAIIPSIWNNEVVIVDNKPYLTADNLESASDTPLLNPSYFSPAAYRIFASIDPSHNWLGLANQSYITLQEASQAQLGSTSSNNLPPNWVSINRQTGQLQAPSNSSNNTDFGFDAFRVIWQCALDWQWNKPSEAKNTLALFNGLLNSWNQQHKLFAIYTHSGQPAASYSSIALYGGTLGYFIVIHPSIATQIYEQHLVSLFNPATGKLETTLNYYDNNWAWFGSAMYSNQLYEYLPKGVTT